VSAPDSVVSARAIPGAVGRGASTAVFLVLGIVALYVGREIFIPLALAVLLSFMLAPLLSWLERRRLPKIPAVILVVGLAFSLVSAFGLIFVVQIAQLAENLPSYQSNIQAKIRAIKISGGPDGPFGQISVMVQELGDEVARPAAPAGPLATLPPTAFGGDRKLPPIAVEIAPPNLTPFQFVEAVIGPLIAPLVSAGIVIVFVIFILFYRHDLRDRLIRLASVGDINRTTQVLEDAATRVAQYLLMQAIVNICYGIPIGIGLWFIGVPNSLLWGILAIVFRFVPYLGLILAAAFPVVLSIAVDSGWTMLLWTAALFVAMEIVNDYIVEPWVYGAKTGLSPIAIILAAIFWTWLWGTVGLLLSTPLTVCLLVLGRHVPQFAFLDVLLGSERVLTAQESLHQRLIALDPDEATVNAEEYLQKHSLEEFYDQVAIPAMVSIERDRARDVLDDERRGKVVEGITTLIDNLSDVKEKADDGAAAGEPESAPTTKAAPSGARSPDRHERQALCIGARGNIDDAAAAILAQLAERRGIGARSMSWVAAGASSGDLSRISVDGIRMVCLIYLNENSIAHARYLIRRLRRRMPATPVLVAFLSMSVDPAAQSSLRAATGADFVAISLKDILDQISAAWRAPVTAAVGDEKAVA
jgi:predicted PurR-regulated permease PerM